MNSLLTVFRWMIFLPIAIVLTQLCQGIPLAAVEFLRTTAFSSDTLSIITVVVLLSFGLALMGVWVMGVVLSFMIPCYFIAPNYTIAASIFGTVFILFQILFFIGLIRDGSWWTAAYCVHYTIAVIGMSIFIGKDSTMKKP